MFTETFNVTTQRMVTETTTVTKNISKNDVLRFIGQYHNPKHNALMTQVPINDENMMMIRFVQKVLGIPIHLRWRGPKWKWGYHTKEGATNVSVYARDRSISFKLEEYRDGIHYIKVISSKYIKPDWD